MTDKPTKINVGFLGGPVLSARVAASALAELRRALREPQWYELTTEDGTIDLDLTKVVYVLIDEEGHRVGFGA